MPKIAVTGLSDALAVFDELANEIGDKKANSKILIPAAREAMKPVLSMAQTLAPVDTGGLRLSLQVEARRPNKRDQRSKYSSPTDTVIALVTTASGRKLKQMSEGAGLIQARKRLAKLDNDAHVGAYRANKFMGIEGDARAIAQEFGSAHNGAQPFMRPALEANASLVANKLGEIIGRRVEQFRAKNIK